MVYAIYKKISENFNKGAFFQPNQISNYWITTAMPQIHDTWLSAGKQRVLSALCLIDKHLAFIILSQEILRNKQDIYTFYQT